jgi:hypothetical protein
MPRHKAPVEVKPRAAPFDAAAAAVLGELRSSLGLFIEALPGPVRTAADIQRALGLDWALSWQIFRVGSVAEPIEAGPDVPRPVPVAKALRAAEAKGVSPELIGRVQRAFDGFEKLVKEHAGDRGSFDSMVRALRTDAPHVSVKERRGAFRNLSSIWGVKADVRYHCGISHPGDRPETHNSVILNGYIGLRKLRPGAPVVIASRSKLDVPAASAPPEKVAMDLLEGFCSQPPPTLAVRDVDAEVAETTLEIGDVGRSGATTHILRRSLRNHSPHATNQGISYGSSVVCRLPCEAMVLDLLVPVTWSDPGTMQVQTYGNLYQQDRGWNRNESDRMPVEESMVHLGQSLDRMQTPLIPRCPEMIASVLEHAGWGGDRFDIYRCIVEYPILHACVATRVDAKADSSGENGSRGR